MHVAESSPPVRRDEEGHRAATDPSAGVAGPSETPAGAVHLVRALCLASVLAVVITAVLLPPGWPAWERFAIVAVLGTLANLDGPGIYVGRRQVRISFSLSELGILVALVFLPGVAAVVSVMVSILLSQVIHRRPLVKGAFNLSQHTLGVSAAALTLSALPSLGSVAEGVSLVSASVATVVYVSVTVLLWLLLFRQLLGPAVWEALLPTVGLDAIASLGSVSVAVVGVYLWDRDPFLLVYAVVPLIAILAAYRLMRASQELTRQRAADVDGLRRLMSSTTDGIVMIEGDGRVQVWNPVMEALTGVDAATAEGRPLTEVMQDVRRSAPAPLGADGDTVATWAAGRVLEERSSRVHGGEHGEAGRVIVLRDITSQHEADALKSDFVARVSHELRTPLTPLAGFIELLRRQGDRFDPERRDEALNAMSRNARRMAALVDELLRVAEFDDGRLDHRSAAIDLAPVADAAPRRLRLDASSHRILIDVPAGTFAMGDAERLADVLGHLLDNAVRYSPVGATVRLEATREDQHVVLRVHDEGPGIPQASWGLVFERFSRLEEPLRMRTGGLGLGLFVARRLAETMDGGVEITKSDHRGTTMEVRLPALAHPH